MYPASLKHIFFIFPLSKYIFFCTLRVHNSHCFSMATPVSRICHLVFHVSLSLFFPRSLFPSPPTPAALTLLILHFDFSVWMTFSLLHIKYFSRTVFQAFCSYIVNKVGSISLCMEDNTTFCELLMEHYNLAIFLVWYLFIGHYLNIFSVWKCKTSALQKYKSYQPWLI